MLPRLHQTAPPESDGGAEKGWTRDLSALRKVVGRVIREQSICKSDAFALCLSTQCLTPHPDIGTSSITIPSKPSTASIRTVLALLCEVTC